MRTLVARFGCEAALYVGDDVTDEDAFAVGAPLVFGIHVGKGPSLAPWCLRAQADVDALLERLVAARERAVPRARRRGAPGRGGR